MGKGVIQSILDFLFPPRCPVCRAYVEQLGDWCPACMKAAQQPHAILLPALSQVQEEAQRPAVHCFVPAGELLRAA